MQESNVKNNVKNRVICKDKKQSSNDINYKNILLIFISMAIVTFTTHFFKKAPLDITALISQWLAFSCGSVVSVWFYSSIFGDDKNAQANGNL